MVVALKPLHDAAPGEAGGREQLPGHQRRRPGRQPRPGRRHPGAAWPASRTDTSASRIRSPSTVIPQIGSPKHQGYTSEEMKMVQETRKILGDDSIQICATCVRVPVSNCHSESILVETERKVTRRGSPRSCSPPCPGIVVMDDLAKKVYPMPINCDRRDEVFVGRIREEFPRPNGLAFWCVSDNLRKGAATNAVQIAGAGCRTAAAPAVNMPTCAHLKLTLAYDGTAYAGWQVQPGQRTCKGCWKRQLARITG